jgi:hypothetical protein
MGPIHNKNKRIKSRPNSEKVKGKKLGPTAKLKEN